MLLERDIVFLSIFVSEKDSTAIKAELLFEAIDQNCDEFITVD
jgi:hypothetical protein